MMIKPLDEDILTDTIDFQDKQVCFSLIMEVYGAVEGLVNDAIPESEIYNAIRVRTKMVRVYE